ncbi:MAG: hypothetical protein E7I11_25045, partial [Klebsiella michiganensis]|nr:hypothetical protein [Klebsiella michiganensis]
CSIRSGLCKLSSIQSMITAITDSEINMGSPPYAFSRYYQGGSAVIFAKASDAIRVVISTILS